MLTYSAKDKLRSAFYLILWIARDSCKATIMLIYGSRYLKKFDRASLLKRYEGVDGWDVVLLDATIKLIEGLPLGGDNNLYTRASGLQKRPNLVAQFWKNSHACDQLRWARCTHFFSSFDAKNLSKFYNTDEVSSYDGVLKLANIGYMADRLTQFKLVGANHDLGQKSYLEFGGSTGVLPLIAALRGFKRVVNVEASSSALNAGLAIAQNLELENFKGSEYLIPGEKYDYISCHQVIEHFSNPADLLTLLRAAMNDDSVLFITAGYHCFPHPGHFPFVGSLSQLYKSQGFQIIRSENEEFGGLFMLKLSASPP